MKIDGRMPVCQRNFAMLAMFRIRVTCIMNEPAEITVPMV
jgi:hypothetical protein